MQRSRLPLALAALLTLTAACASSRSYPLGPEMARLEQDVLSEDYAATLGPRSMIANDLDAELLRLEVADNATVFAAEHGGVERVLSDASLRAAYERRRTIEEHFLALLRREYRERGIEERFESSLAEVRREAGAEERVVRAADASEARARIETVPPTDDPAAGWPRWRGPGGQGLVQGSIPTRWSADESVLWSVEVPGAGNSSPVVHGDRIFLTTAYDRGARRALLCFSRESGDLLWSTDAPAAPPEEKVMDKNGWASATVTTDGERVVAFFGNTGVVSFTLEGDVEWHHPLPPFQAMHGTGASPVLAWGRVFLFQEQSWAPSVLVALDARTGDEVWSRESTAALGWSTPVPVLIDGEPRLLWGRHHQLAAIDPRTGEDIWWCGGPTREVVPTVVVGGGLVYCASGRNGPTLAVRPGGRGDVTDSHLAWRLVRGAPHVPSPALSGDRLWLVKDNGIVTCLDAASGEVHFQERLGGKFTASPIVGDGKVYLTSEAGDTYVLADAETPEVLATNSLGEGVLASPAVVDGTLYMRSRTRLWAIRSAE